MLPVASGLLQVYSNLSNCNYCIFFKEILLEIGFIEEMRTIWGNKEVPQTFFHNFLYLRKYDLISFDFVPLSTLHSQFCDFTKGIILQKFLQTKKRDFHLVAVRSLAITKSKNLAIVTGTCKPRLPVLIYSIVRLLWFYKIAKSRVANHGRSQDFWLGGGGGNHKSHAMMSSEIFKKGTFCGAKIS